MYYLEKDFYKIAKKNLKVSLSFEDENAEAHHYLANIYREDKDPNQAKKHYYRALEINPDFALAFLIWVITAWKLAILMRLKFIIKKPLILTKNYATAYFQLAKTLQNPSEFDQAYRNYETALEIDPSLTECHYQFANLPMKGEKLKNDGTHVLEPDLDRAEIHLRKAIAIDKEFYKAYYKLGNLLCLEEKFDEAYSLYEQCLRIENSYAKAHYKIAVLLMSGKTNHQTTGSK